MFILCCFWLQILTIICKQSYINCWIISLLGICSKATVYTYSIKSRDKQPVGVWCFQNLKCKLILHLLPLFKARKHLAKTFTRHHLTPGSKHIFQHEFYAWLKSSQAEVESSRKCHMIQFLWINKNIPINLKLYFQCLAIDIDLEIIFVTLLIVKWIFTVTVQ